MKTNLVRRSVPIAVAIVIASLSAALAQAPPRALDDAAIEKFLRTAEVLRTRSTDKGVTGSLRATLSDGTLTHDAQIQTVDQSRPTFNTGKTMELNFRDSWKFNIAAYRIDRLLGLRMVPVSVERTWRGRGAAFTWWVDEAMMDEGQRLRDDLQPPDQRCWNEQARMMRVFDQLIDNSDRNLGNMLITPAWRMWLIDHTRAFRRSRTPREPASLTRIDRRVLERLVALDPARLKREVGRYIDGPELRALLSRRDAIVAHFRELGPSAVFERTDPAQPCGVAP